MTSENPRVITVIDLTNDDNENSIVEPIDGFQVDQSRNIASIYMLSEHWKEYQSIRPSFRVAKRTAPDERPAEDGDGEQPKRIKTERQTSAVVQPLPPTGPAAPPSPGPGPAAPAPGPTAPPPGPAALQDIFPGIECPICLETHQENLVSTICGHIFCKPCLKESMRAVKQCPKCRKRIRQCPKCRKWINIESFHDIFIY